MMIRYVIGDATEMSKDKSVVLVHCVNDIGAWGAGFSGTLSKMYPITKVYYHYWAKGKIANPRFKLGQIQVIPINSKFSIVNLIGQQGIRSRENPVPVHYPALHIGLRETAKEARRLGAEIHCPRLGCGLAGGDWKIVEKIIQEECIGIDVIVYTLK